MRTPNGIGIGALIAALLVAVGCGRQVTDERTGEERVVEATPAQEPPVGDELELSEAEWRERLSEAEYEILREEGTERAYSGAWWDHKEAGTYLCAGCGAPLFSSADKYRSGTGWPSFTRPVDPQRVGTRADEKLFTTRTEVHCARCGGHLGHVFEDGPEPTGLRYCINSVSLDFRPSSETASAP